MAGEFIEDIAGDFLAMLGDRAGCTIGEFVK